jgi:hypothetical protein
VKILAALIIHFFMIVSLHAGELTCVIGIVDVSLGEPTKVSKRLFELLEMDAREIYTKSKAHVLHGATGVWSRRSNLWQLVFLSQ